MLFDLDSLVTLTAMLGADGRIVDANTAMENVLGLSRKKLKGLRFASMLENSEAFELALEKASKSSNYSSFRYEAVLLCLSASETLDVQVNMAYIEAQEQWLLELWPQKTQLRGQLDDRFQEQSEANKMLLRNLAHEIKNPLGGIRGAAQLLEMEVSEYGLNEYTQVIIHEADRLQNLVDRLLEPHRHPQQLEMVNIHEVLERVRSLVLMEYPTGLRVEQNYDISLPDFKGDRNQLIQVFLNIVQNAAQALKAQIAQGSAHIELRTRAARMVSVGRQLHKLALELHVVDNGPGISEEIRDRIFFPLVSGRDGGSGLGLSLAQTFIQRHGGMIECESIPGKTDFKIIIPFS